MRNTEKVEETEKGFDIDKKVTIRNMASWPVGFQRIETVGDVYIPAGSAIKISRSEIMSQVNMGNKLIAGTYGNGDHATIFIDDAETRIELGFEGQENPQKIITEATVKEIFAKKRREDFEEAFTEAVKTMAEKDAVMKLIAKLKINDYAKIRFAEDYTGLRL